MTGVYFDACTASSSVVLLDAGTSPEPTVQCPACNGEVGVHWCGPGRLVINRHRPAVSLNGYVGVHTPACYAQDDPDSCICPDAELLDAVL